MDTGLLNTRRELYSEEPTPFAVTANGRILARGNVIKLLACSLATKELRKLIEELQDLVEQREQLDVDLMKERLDQIYEPLRRSTPKKDE